MPRILVVDDEPVMRELIEVTLATLSRAAGPRLSDSRSTPTT